MTGSLGSETLHQWKKLSCTDLTGALFDERPGVVTRGESGLSGGINNSSIGSGNSSGSRIRVNASLNSTVNDCDSNSVFSSVSMQECEEDDVTYANQNYQRYSKSERQSNLILQHSLLLEVNQTVLCVLCLDSARMSVFSDPSDASNSHFEEGSRSNASKATTKVAHNPKIRTGSISK